jgi:hypothetical protein
MKNLVVPGSVFFKDPNVFTAYRTHETDKKLVEIEQWVINKYGMLITCAYRKPRHPSDLHGTNPVRATDIRSHCYEQPEAVVNSINKAWEYDYNRPKMLVAFYHDSGSGLHIHLQCHPNTRQRES